MNAAFNDIIFDADKKNFENLALNLFYHQYENVKIYRNFIQALRVNVDQIKSLVQIPFLPIEFFKNNIIASEPLRPQQIFESSGTTALQKSHHYIQDIELYKKSFTKTFKIFYGEPSQYCFLTLLPSYLERNNSSLVFMVNELMQQSGHPLNGFYLHNTKELFETIQQCETLNQKTILLGVTYALMDFAKDFPTQLKNTIVIETGGMKGRKTELTRKEVHDYLKNRFGTSTIHSEYGMTELLSQAYSKSDGIFVAPPWMKVLVRDEDEPFLLHTYGKGAINIIDLANIHSCAFIATSDVGKIYENDRFEILGRLDNSDIRGCSLLINEI